jgi:hypothetical protein
VTDLLKAWAHNAASNPIDEDQKLHADETLALFAERDAYREALHKCAFPNTYHGPCPHCGPLAAEVGSYIARAALARFEKNKP